MGHWYKDNKPVYTVKSKDGKDRDTTLRDARKMGLHISSTSVISILDKPYLSNVWIPDQILQAVLRKIENEGVKNIPSLYIPEAVKSWKEEILHDSRTISRDSSEKGSQIHKSLENILSNRIELSEDVNYAYTKPVIEFLQSKFGDLSLIETLTETSFGHSLGFGGCVDLVLKFKDGRITIIDYKTKNTVDFKKSLAYDEHIVQLASYRLGLLLPKAECMNLFISSKQEGLLQLKEWTEEEVKRGEEMFKHLLKYWQLSNNYDSGY